MANDSSATSPAASEKLRALPASEISGNATLEVKEHILHVQSLFLGKEDRWGRGLKEDTVLVSVDLNQQAHGPRKEAVLAFEMVVQPYMCNNWDMAHGGMIATLLDYTTSLAVPVLLRDQAWLGSGLTLALSVNLLTPALLGEKVRIVATTKAGGKRTATVHGEIWSSRGLVATATHVKMVPQTGPASQSLKDVLEASKSSTSIYRT